jgi:hypothetical protein
MFSKCVQVIKSLFWNNPLLLCAKVSGRVQPVFFSTKL